MTFAPQLWLDTAGGGTPISAARLNRLEAGIAVADAAAANALYPAALNRVWQAIGRVHDLPVRIVNIGDSNSWGSALPDATRSRLRWSALMARKAQAKFNDPGVSGVYFMAWDSDWTVTGTAVTQQSIGLGSNAALIPQTSAITRTVTADRFTVYHQGGNGTAGGYTVTIDGGTPTTVTPSSGSAISHSTADLWVSPQLTLGAHTITITATGTATILDGVYCHAGDYAAGVQIINAGRYGATSTGPLVASSFQRIKALNPALVTYQLLSNNFGVQSDPALYRQDVSNFIERVLSDSPKTAIMLINTHPRGNGTAYTYPEQIYKDQMASLAAARPQQVLYVDTGAMFAQTTRADSSSYDPWIAVNGDHVHMNGAGHEMVSTVLLDEVLSAKWRGVQLPPPEVTPPVPVLLFTPNTLATSTDGAAVTVWPSGGSDTASATVGGGSAPTYKAPAGGQPYIRFASANSLTVQAAQPVGPLTVVSVHRADAAMTGRGAVYNGLPSSPFVQLDHLGGASPTMSFGWSTLNQATGSKVAAAGTWIITALTFAPGDVRNYISTIVPNAVRAGLGDGGAVPGFTIGANAARTGSLFVGDIAYLGVWAGALTQQHIAEIIKPLANTFIVSLTGEQTIQL